MVAPLIVAAGITAVGALGSAYLASRNNKPAKTKQLSTQTKEQKRLEKLINEGLEKGTGPYADLFGKFNPEEFEKGVSEPALQQFKNKTLPALTEKFTNGNIRDSGFRRARINAGEDFSEKLAGLRYQAINQQNQNRIQGINAITGRQSVENVIKPGQPSGWNEVTKNIGNNADTYSKVVEEAIKGYQRGAAETNGSTATVPQTSATGGGAQ